MEGLGPYPRPFYPTDGCPKVSLVVNSPSHHNISHSSSLHSVTTPQLTSFRHGSGSGSVSTPETESSQATDTIGSLERDDDKNGLDHLDPNANNQEDDEPPPPIAARPERTKSIVIPHFI